MLSYIHHFLSLATSQFYISGEKAIIDDEYKNSNVQYQFGFQRNASTLQQLLIYFNKLITSNEEIDTIYIDFRKAFDSVPQNELLVKLWNTGIIGATWNWFTTESSVFP